jgi:uncharacterized membrane protein
VRVPSFLLLVATQTFMALWAIDNGPWWVDLIAVFAWAYALFLAYTSNRIIEIARMRIQQSERWHANQ